MKIPSFPLRTYQVATLLHNGLVPKTEPHIGVWIKSSRMSLVSALQMCAVVRIIFIILTHLAEDSTNYDMQIFAVGDGSYINYSDIGEDWFMPHVRLLTVISRSDKPTLRFFAVGPLNVTALGGFLQVASWDGKVFHFYAVCLGSRLDSNVLC
jgi:hypothetical protein